MNLKPIEEMTRLRKNMFAIFYGGEEFCERRDLNPYAEALDPKSSVYANFTTLADYGKDRSLDPDFLFRKTEI